MRNFISCAALCVALLPTVGAAQDFDKGSSAYDSGDYTAAIREFKPLAEQGNASAQYNLGLMYRMGQGAPQNDIEAARWYKKAA